MFNVEFFNNNPVLVYTDKKTGTKNYLNSRYAPQKEAQRQLNKEQLSGNDLVILFGTGMGYIIEELCRNIKPSNILIIQKNTEVINLINKHFKVNLFENINLWVYDTITDFYDYLKQINISEYKKIIFIFHSAEQKIFSDFYNDVYEKIKNIVDTNISQKITIDKFGKLFYENFFLNMKSIVIDMDVVYLKKYVVNKPAVLIAAGPSLNDYIDLIKNEQKKFYIFAVDTVVDSLIDYGIIPDFAVSIDPQKISINHFTKKNESYDNTILLYEPTCSPAVVNKFSKRFYVSTGFPLMKYFDYKTELFETGGSVATFALKIIEYLSVSQLILIGQDLSVTNKFYSKHTSYHGKKISVLNKFNTFETIEYLNLIKNKLIKVNGNNNTKVYTTYSLLEYLKSFNNCMKTFKNRVYNTSLNGAKIENTVVKKMDEIIDELKPVELDKKFQTPKNRQKEKNKKIILYNIEKDINILKKIIINIKNDTEIVNLVSEQKKYLDLIKVLLYSYNYKNITKYILNDAVLCFEKIYYMSKELI